jgi:hypothetical protein
MPQQKSITRDEYDKDARRLIGNTITKVVYHEIDYLDGKYHFFDDYSFDSLDYGLELELGTGQFLFITWGSEFIQYGVSLIHDRFSTVELPSRFVDVSEISRWKPLLGRQVISVDVFWSWWEEYSNPEIRIYYPQDLLLRFDGDQERVISALEIRDGHISHPMMDNITIFYDVQIAKRFTSLEHGKPTC